ncbi:unnamed protein product [Dibothriocephalus latus]|uniref:Uncharacterized protein n=1 Tax=Dibothriocephalus latus TaxID=60516 RepID=A0A3P6PC36_DIBLA|nr:unnamed protein product [Dibothriocephalus latus]
MLFLISISILRCITIAPQAIRRYRGILCSCTGLSSLSPSRSSFTRESLSKQAFLNWRLGRVQTEETSPPNSSELPPSAFRESAKFDPWPAIQEPRLAVFLKASTQQKSAREIDCSSSLGLHCVRIHIEEAGASWPSFVMKESCKFF